MLDTATDEVVDRVRVGTTPWGVAIRPDGTAAYVSNANEDTVSVIDTATLAVTNTIHIGHVPTGISATQDVAWVSGNASATASAIDLSNHEVLGSVDFGLSAQPAGIVVV